MFTTILSILVISVGLTAGNFFYQSVLAEPNWMAAAERSFFQFFAILLYAILTNK